MPTSDKGIQERLAAAETTIAGVGRDIEAVVASVEKLGRGVSDGFRDIHERLSATRETNWPVILALLAFIGTLIGAAGFLYFRDSERFESTQGRAEVRAEALASDARLAADEQSRNTRSIEFLEREYRRMRDQLETVIDGQAKASVWVDVLREERKAK